jgi:hypothetical protein
MSFFFITIEIRVVEDMVCKNIAFFQEIWEQINKEQREASFLDIKKYLRHCQDINMRWDVLQIPDASISFPTEFVFALDKVVEQRRASLFQTQSQLNMFQQCYPWKHCLTLRQLAGASRSMKEMKQIVRIRSKLKNRKLAP